MLWINIQHLHMYLKKYIKETNDYEQVLVVSTASLFNFLRSIYSELNIDIDEINNFEVFKSYQKQFKMKFPRSYQT